ncbi:MAG: DUF29 domain-containing protein [Candidatus Methylumidiphilus alinenensis]|uniref:DUF29 domain-containing protein n=1 Tax=Candidatus Methylumidiphilus alinenensis TaxID=2202197 RepID=A0A2W4ST65_9GAMM|nr:MAG: DUF29 domain-containing protein [Candidatus Methylumidiphilus alinenensis]
MSASLHDLDFHAWTQEQLRLIRSGRLDELDLSHLQEEIESMGASERRELGNRLAVLLAHLLKWQFQPERRGASWRLTIEEQRQRSARVLRQNPSLKSRLDEIFQDAYADARLVSARETGLDKRAFPDEPPYSVDQAFDVEFYPD